MKETEIASAVVVELQDMGWEVYQEVQVNALGPIADIVAIRGSVSWVIEVKRSRTFAVLDQAQEWLRCANMVSVATPRTKTRGPSRTWCHVLEHFGIGWWVGGQVHTWPRLSRKLPPSGGIASVLHEEQKTVCLAGSANGGHWTPFRATVDRLKKVVREFPGIRLSEAVEKADHHYASRNGAISSLRSYINSGVIKGLECRRGYLWISETNPTEPPTT